MTSIVSVAAASFDGIYDYAYNLNGPSGWETHRVDSGFIVRNGRISSDPPALSGNVDSGGNVQFTGPSPYGNSSATFTGSIGSDGTGEGTYTDSQGLIGSWGVDRVSGGSGFMGIVDTLMSFMYSLSFIGEAVGLSGTTAAATGTAAVIFVFVSVIAIVTTKGSRRGKSAVRDDRVQSQKSKVHFEYSQQRAYEASQPEAPSRTQEAPAPFIGVPPPPQSPPVGLHVEGRALPERLDLRSVWRSDGVDLVWDRPPFDPEKYKLYGYEVTRLFYDGSSTVPSRTDPFRLRPDITRLTDSFEQTYRWNIGGDINGYRVDAVFRDLNLDIPNRFVRVGSTAYAPIG